MFLSRKIYDGLRLDYAKANEEARVLATQNAVHISTLDWLKVRVNQLERERAQLLFQATGARLSIPEIVKAEPDGNPLLALPTTFEDVGDDLAQQVGIYHNSDGTLRFGSPNETIGATISEG